MRDIIPFMSGFVNEVFIGSLIYVHICFLYLIMLYSKRYAVLREDKGLI